MKNLMFKLNAENINVKCSIFFEAISKITLCIVMLSILIGIAWAAIITINNLNTLFNKNIHTALKVLMVNSLTILALLEVFETIRVYFSKGRVKVTYIIDTVLVVVLTEVMVFWFKDIEYTKILMFIGLVLSLIFARILTIKFSPAIIGDEVKEKIVYRWQPDITDWKP